MFKLFDASNALVASGPDIHWADAYQGWVIGTTAYPDAARAFSLFEIKTSLSRADFKMQFSAAEYIAIQSARVLPVSPTPTQVAIKGQLDFFYEILGDSTVATVDLASPFVITGVGALAAVGLITSDRAATILAGVSVPVLS